MSTSGRKLCDITEHCFDSFFCSNARDIMDDVEISRASREIIYQFEFKTRIMRRMSLTCVPSTRILGITTSDSAYYIELTMSEIEMLYQHMQLKIKLKVSE